MTLENSSPVSWKVGVLYPQSKKWGYGTPRTPVNYAYASVAYIVSPSLRLYQIQTSIVTVCLNGIKTSSLWPSSASMATEKPYKAMYGKRFLIGSFCKTRPKKPRSSYCLFPHAGIQYTWKFLILTGGNLNLWKRVYISHKINEVNENLSHKFVGAR